MALGLVLWFVRGSLGNVLARQNRTSEGEQSLHAQMQTQIADLHDRNRELNDRNHELMRETIKLATAHGEKMMAAIADVRREYHDGMVRVHAKLEKTEAELDDCRRRHEECDERVAALELKIGAR